MDVEFTKRADGGSRAAMTRPDGVRLLLWSYDRTGEMPHDAVHLVGEQALAISGGLWGSIAAGAIFDSIEIVDGRQRHDWRRRSAEVRRRNAEQLAMAETVVGVLQRCLELEAPKIKAELNKAWGITRVGPSPFSPDQGARAAADLRELRSQWCTMTAGQTLSLAWHA